MDRNRGGAWLGILMEGREGAGLEWELYWRMMRRLLGGMHRP